MCMADSGPEGATESGARESAGLSAGDPEAAGTDGVSFSLREGALAVDSPTHVRLAVPEDAHASPDVNHGRPHIADRDGEPPRASNGNSNGRSPTGTGNSMTTYVCGFFASKNDPDGHSRAINTLPAGVPVPKSVGLQSSHNIVKLDAKKVLIFPI